jgi:hypothetical protein
MMTNQPIFENAVCSRCCGTGKHSYNQIHGDVCYGCHGSGFKLTKRGSAAAAYLKSMRTGLASSVKIGDLIQWSVVTPVSTGYFFGVVENILKDERDPLRFSFVTTRNGELHVWHQVPKSTVRFGFTVEEKKAQVEKALAYQATLTKDGKVSKKLSKAA